MPIALIHTGGTIGMAPGPAGLAPKAGILEAALGDLQRSGQAADIRLTTLAPLIDSADATFADWNRIAREVARQHDEVQGFVITHGTDTMAFTGAALCFALQGLGRPVVLTGAMSPLGTPGGDGEANLAAALGAAQNAPPGVWLQFGGQLLHGARLRKVHTSDHAAFAAPAGGALPRRAGAELTLHPYATPRIAILTMAPGGAAAPLSAALDHCDGAVLRVFGSGTVPNVPGVRGALARAKQRQIPLIAVSQAADGGVTLGAYAAGQVLLDTGVTDGRAMTAEAAFAKLAYALSLPTDHRAAALVADLCGEMGVG